MSASSQRPSLEALRGVAQPPSIFARNSGEHWAGRLYVRRYSIQLTRLLVPTRVTPNALTWLMLAVGLAAAAVLTLPGIWPAVAAVLLIQAQILLDCSDGELARWRQQFSVKGV
ncbi:MAG: CDP-alcohol phosphatidyltransferase family protein, partial [Solirubrobacteraceae bacterium]